MGGGPAWEEQLRPIWTILDHHKIVFLRFSLERAAVGGGGTPKLIIFLRKLRQNNVLGTPKGYLASQKVLPLASSLQICYKENVTKTMFLGLLNKEYSLWPPKGYYSLWLPKDYSLWPPKGYSFWAPVFRRLGKAILLLS